MTLWGGTSQKQNVPPPPPRRQIEVREEGRPWAKGNLWGREKKKGKDGREQLRICNMFNCKKNTTCQRHPGGKKKMRGAGVRASPNSNSLKGQGGKSFETKPQKAILPTLVLVGRESYREQ